MVVIGIFDFCNEKESVSFEEHNGHSYLLMVQKANVF